jgi:hypothetical protein
LCYLVSLSRIWNANAFTVPPNVRYEAEIRAAEQEAREAERGLWAGSEVALKIIQIEADAPGSDNENPNGEWIEIANQGDGPVSMQGYTLKDEANHIYSFGDFTVPPTRASASTPARAATTRMSSTGASPAKVSGTTMVTRPSYGMGRGRWLIVLHTNEVLRTRV